VSRTFTLLVLSNDYLTVTLLPELGGRVYEMIFKPTGHNELYRNPVLKPAPWGPLEQGWWLAAGGLEWGFPTDEHGYEWGVPWHYHITTSSAGVTVTLQDSYAITRPTVSVAVFLPSERAALVVQPQLTNSTFERVGVKYWTNAMLAPGAANRPSADLRFLFPGDQVTVHSRGDPHLPPEGELMDWPVHNGLDYGRLGNWNRWLGFFEAPQAHGSFTGVYDPVANEGVLRVYPAALATGSKGFAFGWKDPVPSDRWTDDGSGYVEVHGGLMPTFWDTATLSPGQVISWTEVWYPVNGLGGVSAASDKAALHLEGVDDTLALGLYTPVVHDDVQVFLWDVDCRSLGHWRLPQIGPAYPFSTTLPAPESKTGELSLVALSADEVLLGSVNPTDCLPPLATVDPLPFYVTIPTFTVSWHGEDIWSGVASYDVQFRVGYEGDWLDWLTGTTAISATFSGTPSQTVFFRARARDQAGNVGALDSEEWGQTFTTILLAPAPVLVTSRKLVTPVAPTLLQPVTYTLVLSNTGNLTATTLVVTDHLPMTLMPGTGLPESLKTSKIRSHVFTWSGALPPGRELVLAYSVGATSATPVGVPLTNSVWIMADGIEPFRRQAPVTFRQPLFLPMVIGQEPGI
jgi:uncharacterized repeat protein (TIGR01451 family)